MLQCFLKIELDTLTTFQKKVWIIVNCLLRDLIINQLSESSFIEKGGIGIDVFLRLKSSYFILYMSIQEDNLIINSEHFDIYVYHETKLDKIELLLKNLFQGKYFIKLGYGRKSKLVHQELIFNHQELHDFNEHKRIGLFPRKIESEKRIDGVKFIKD